MDLLRPRCLRPGDLIGLINPSGPVHEADPYDDTREALAALGLRTREAPNVRARYGHMAGTPQQRADDLHAMFTDPDVAGILAVTGGSGANRVLPLLDYELIRRHPKWLGGFSDLTALITAVHVKTGLVTFHSPLGRSNWNPFSIRHFQAVAMDVAAARFTLPDPATDGRSSDEVRCRALVGGRASGRLMGGNLAVLTSLAGTPYFPDLRGALLFLEDVNEYVYRIDRMLTTLTLGDHLQQVAGIVLGGFTQCKPSEGSYGSLTLDEVFMDHFGPLGVPVLRGAPFGHIARKWTLPLGVPAELDADAGTLRLLEPAVT
jgi:muramoyltetrapeptide carboxypeptidase